VWISEVRAWQGVWVTALKTCLFKRQTQTSGSHGAPIKQFSLTPTMAPGTDRTQQVCAVNYVTRRFQNSDPREGKCVFVVVSCSALHACGTQ